jgi:hypothetical protein
MGDTTMKLKNSRKTIILSSAVLLLSVFSVESSLYGGTKVTIVKPYGDRDIKSPGRAVIEYYNPDVGKAFVYQGDLFIQREYAPGALRDNVFLVKAFDDNLTYEVSLADIDRFEIRCQICSEPAYCCSDITVTLKDGGTMEGELYCEGSFDVDSTQNEDLQSKPWIEFGLKTDRGVIKLRQQSGVKWIDSDLKRNLNCAFCNSHFGRIVSCTMEWSSEYKNKLKRLRDK